MQVISRKKSLIKTISIVLLFLALAVVLYSCYPGDEITASDTDIVATFFEKEGIAVWIVRLLEGNQNDNNRVAFSDSVITALQKNLGNNNTTKITSWMFNPDLSPSQKKGIGVEYDVELSKNTRWRTISCKRLLS